MVASSLTLLLTALQRAHSLMPQKLSTLETLSHAYKLFKQDVAADALLPKIEARLQGGAPYHFVPPISVPIGANEKGARRNDSVASA
jgi:hypothetical protein